MSIYLIGAILASILYLFDLLLNQKYLLSKHSYESITFTYILAILFSWIAVVVWVIGYVTRYGHEDKKEFEEKKIKKSESKSDKTYI